MSPWIDTACRFLFDAWQGATLADYLQLTLAVIIVGWFFSRYGSSR